MKRDVLAAIGALVVDDDFALWMLEDPDAALAAFAATNAAVFTDEERTDVKEFVRPTTPRPAVAGLRPGPCPWWPCAKYQMASPQRVAQGSARGTAAKRATRPARSSSGRSGARKASR